MTKPSGLNHFVLYTVLNNKQYPDSIIQFK